MKKTYAETRRGRGKPFDWQKEIKSRKRNGLGSTEKLRIRSMSWVSCACGNQCAVIPRDDIGRPLDEILLDLGGAFAGDVDLADWDEALSTLVKIERRSFYIIETMRREATEQKKEAKEQTKEANRILRLTA